MANWNIEPTVPSVDSRDGGVFEIPENTGSTEVKYLITYTDDNGCVATTEYIVQPCETSCTITNLTSLDGLFPSQGSEYKLWWTSYEITYYRGSTVTNTVSGTGMMDFEIEGNTSTEERTICTNDGKIKLQALIDDETGENIFDNGCSLANNYCFTQEGKAPEVDLLIGCSQVYFHTQDLIGVVGVWQAEGIVRNFGDCFYSTTAIDQDFTVNPVRSDGTTPVWYKSADVVFNCQYTCPYFSHSSKRFVIACGPGEEYSTGGTSGYSTSNMTYVTEAFGQGEYSEFPGVITIQSRYKQMSLKEIGGNYVKINVKSDSYTNLLSNKNACPFADDIYIAVDIFFDVYINQTTKTGETMRCGTSVKFLI